MGRKNGVKKEIKVKGNIAEITITNNKNTVVTIIDKEDVEKIRDKKLTIAKNGYVIIYIKEENKYIYLSRYLLLNKVKEQQEKLKKKLVVDHINQDILDNRKENLRIVDYAVNQFNRKSKGYTCYKDKYITTIKKNNIVYRKVFNTKEEAIKSRLKLEVILFGEKKCNKDLYNKYKILEEINMDELWCVEYRNNKEYKDLLEYVKANTMYKRICFDKKNNSYGYETSFVKIDGVDYSFDPVDGLMMGLNKKVKNIMNI